MSVRTNDAPFLSSQMSLWNFRSSPGRWLSMGMQYLTPRPSVVVIKETEAAWTILRAIYLVIVFLHTCDEWILSIYQVPLCYRTRFRENREKRNPYDWRTQVHHQWCARLTGTMSMGKRRGVRVSLTFIDGSSLNWSAVRSDAGEKFGWLTSSPPR